jgi:hypothetical protein
LDETQAALIATRAPIYQMGGSLVHPVRGQTQPTSTFENPRSSGRLSANPIGKHRLREYFLSAAAYVKIVSDDGKPKKVPFNPPLSFAEHLLGRGDAWTFPVLTGIVTSPTLRSDGSVVAKDGYDAQSGLIVDLQGMDFPPVPAIPSWDEARSALDALAQTLSEFPFVADEDGDSPSGTRPSQSRSVALAMLITAVARPAFRTAPIFGISAPTMATGKSLLADIPALILTGRSATKMSQGATQEEDEKRLLAVLLQGDQVVVIDNVARPIRGDAICTILTEDSWRCRMLGRSEMREVQTRTLFIATGNNLAFHEDISSRAILVSLDAETERPDERTFRCDVRSYVPANRMTLAAAALTVLRAYIAAGRPPIEGMKPSRFTEWDVVRAALIWLGEPDPWGTNAKVSSNDGTRTDHVDLMVSIKDVFGIGKWLSATQIIDASKTDDPAAKQLDAALNAIYPRSACLIPDRRLPSATEGLLNVWNVGGSRHATTMRLAL